MDDRSKRKITPPDDLERFDRRKAPPTEEPWVTRTSTGYFVYNPASYAALGSPAAVEYLYSPKKQILGFRAADPDERHTYPVYHQGHSRNYQSAGKAFHTYYGLSTDQALRYKAELIGDTLYIDLNDENAVPVSRKSRSEE